MRKYKDCVAVVTGAGSGIGRALAVRLAKEGAKLAISDFNQAGLDETVSMLGEADLRADYLDVTNKEAVFAYAETVRDHFGHVNMVINNAGAALNGEFAEVDVENVRWQMDVNFWGVVYGSKAFLPILEEAEWGHIVNISSLFGLIAFPGNSAYNASKFAVRGLTECMRIELKMAGSTVSATSVHPGGIKTNVARNARSGRKNSFTGGRSHEEMIHNFDKAAITTADKAAEVILRGAAKDKMRVLIGGDAWVMDKVQRLFPSFYFPIMKRLLGKGMIE